MSFRSLRSFKIESNDLYSVRKTLLEYRKSLIDGGIRDDFHSLLAMDICQVYDLYANKVHDVWEEKHTLWESALKQMISSKNEGRANKYDISIHFYPTEEEGLLALWLGPEKVYEHFKNNSGLVISDYDGDLDHSYVDPVSMRDPESRTPEMSAFQFDLVKPSFVENIGLSQEHSVLYTADKDLRKKCLESVLENLNIKREEPLRFDDITVEVLGITKDQV